MFIIANQLNLIQKTTVAEAAGSEATVAEAAGSEATVETIVQKRSAIQAGTKKRRSNDAAGSKSGSNQRSTDQTGSKKGSSQSWSNEGTRFRGLDNGASVSSDRAWRNISKIGIILNSGWDLPDGPARMVFGPSTIAPKSRRYWAWATARTAAKATWKPNILKKMWRNYVERTYEEFHFVWFFGVLLLLGSELNDVIWEWGWVFICELVWRIIGIKTTPIDLNCLQTRRN